MKVGSRYSLSPPALGALLGILSGLADWLAVVKDWGHSQAGVWYLPPVAVPALVWTSVTLCTAAGLAFSSPRLGRLRALPLAASALIVAFIRGGVVLQESLGLSPRAVFAGWLALILIVAVPLSRLPLRATRHLKLWLTGTAASIVLLGVLAVNPSLGVARGWPAANLGARPPNVVLIFLDTIRYDDAFGPAAEMPHLASFASHAASFDNAWAAAPWTVPSHYSVLTGLDPWSIPFGHAGFNREDPSLAIRLRDRGYDTVAILANPLLGSPDFLPGFRTVAYSWESGVCRSEFGQLTQRLAPDRLHSLCGMMAASEVTNRALRYVRGAEGPYFLFINYIDGHGPYYVPPECRDRTVHAATFPDLEAVWTPDTHARDLLPLLQKAREQHRAAARCMDRSLGTLLDALKDRPDTAVIVVGDHGEQFGEHDLILHGNSLYAQLLHVPLVVKAPGFAGHVSEAVSLTDLYRSILTMARSGGSGGAVSAILDARARRPAASSYETDLVGNPAKAWSVAQGSYHFIAWHDGHEALYDLSTDPSETSPLSTTSGAGAVAVGPLRQIVAHVVASTDPRSVQFRALDYIK